MTPVTLIAAVARNGVIGGGNRLLWRLKADLRRFRALTMGKPLIMGRKTYESIGQPLPGRHTIVVTRDPTFRAAGVETACSPEAALERADLLLSNEIMIGGGGQLYAALIPRAHRLRLTLVDLAPEGDAFFPEVSPTEWREVSRVQHRRSADDEADFAFVDSVRRDAR